MNFQIDNLETFFLRVGLAYVFLFVAIVSFVNPSTYLFYVPKFVSEIIPANYFLSIYGVFEVILGLWLLSGKKSFYAALVAAALLFLITALNLAELGVLFRNVAIFFSALALAASSTDKKV